MRGHFGHVEANAACRCTHTFGGREPCERVVRLDELCMHTSAAEQKLEVCKHALGTGRAVCMHLHKVRERTQFGAVADIWLS